MNEKSAYQHDTILDSINEGVFTVDLNWRITDFNRAAERITCVKREDAIGLFCSEVFRANICENACALRQTLTSGQPVVNAYAHIISDAGNRIPIRLSTALLTDCHGETIGGVETFQDMTQIEQLRKELESRYTFEDIIGRGPGIRQIFQILPQIAESDSTVLIEGASGTGKELFARAIHNLSGRRNKRFVAINCAALPDSLLESELFGYEAGAFTGANKSKPGRFTLADGGTLFLDEIGDISPAMQVRLLRVLQEQSFEPLGSIESLSVDVRILAATNKDISELVKSGQFREDLFYRIRVINLKLPPLKERREDIPLLVDHIVAKLNRLKNRHIAGVSKDVLAWLMAYSFPGNIRELENIIEHAFVLCRGDLVEFDHMPLEFRPNEILTTDWLKKPTTLKAMEIILIEDALRRHAGNRRKAALDLGIDISTLFRKIKKLNLI